MNWQQLCEKLSHLDPEICRDWCNICWAFEFDKLSTSISKQASEPTIIQTCIMAEILKARALNKGWKYSIEAGNEPPITISPKVSAENLDEIRFWAEISTSDKSNYEDNLLTRQITVTTFAYEAFGKSEVEALLTAYLSALKAQQE